MSNRLETLLRKAGRELADWQVARLFKVPEEMQQTPVDFFGYTASGRAILIEAKLVDRDSLPIGCSPGLQPHQWNELQDANRAGALALICWARTASGSCATITVDIAMALSKDRASIPWKGIDHRYFRPMTGPEAHLRLLSHWLSRSDPVVVRPHPT